MTLDIWSAARPNACERGFDLTKQHPGLCQCPQTPAAGPQVGKPGPVAGQEWSIFTAALRSAVRADGTICQTRARAAYRGRIEPRHLGSLYRKARDRGLIVDTGEREESTDTPGRNADKLARVYRWAAAAA